MSYPQFQVASDYLGAIADEDYVKALPSNSYEDRGGAVLDGPEAGYKVTYTQADAEAVTDEDGRVILMDEHLADFRHQQTEADLHTCYYYCQDVKYQKYRMTLCFCGVLGIFNG